jgi:hypothetical protein
MKSSSGQSWKTVFSYVLPAISVETLFRLDCLEKFSSVAVALAQSCLRLQVELEFCANH